MNLVPNDIYPDFIKLGSEIRDDIKKKFPKFKYFRVFTERRKKTIYRSKMWGVYSGSLMIVVDYINKKYNGQGIKAEFWGTTSIVLKPLC